MTDVDEMAANLNAMRGERVRGDEGVRGEGITREVPEENVRIGRSGPMAGRTSRAYRYDRLQGAATATLAVVSDKADRMPLEAAAIMLDKIHRHFRVDREMEGVLYDFDSAMYLCYTLNGGSQFTPSDRVKFYIGAMGNGFEFSEIHSMLSVDFRRFFRAFANDVIDACKRIIYHCDFEDVDQVEMRQQLLNLAQQRGILRYPHCVADCCDAATNVSAEEMHAIVLSKQAVVGATTNSVDRRNTAVTIRSADNFDSSVGQTVPAVTEARAAPTYYT